MFSRLVNRLLFSLALLGLISGCALTPGSKPSAERFELDVPAAASPAVLPISDITLRAPSWLETTQMGYRLRYAHAVKRESYTLTRWVATPSEMVLQSLKRGVPQGGDAAGCRLRVELDEFVQDFTSAQDSVARIEARVRLIPSRGEGGASRRFELLVPASFADATGGAQALSAATQKWIAELRAWLVTESQANRALCKG